ncbi:hypothetical protein [Gandjariella thermophila]|uniref:Uncharacterized protein n=1 Tax=Gandjariella thermophila TaxID=1931992 RepID=A0A4D4J686_9PSEU|nr:hypothetical protein [Gandjariella thermophila]GDY30099.1 hypothetical protein GTS_17320 [Gandjariella thermophila]
MFVAEVPQDREPRMQVALKVVDADAFRPAPAVEVVTPFEDTHYGTREMTVGADADERDHRVHRPVAEGIPRPVGFQGEDGVLPGHPVHRGLLPRPDDRCLGLMRSTP